MKTPLEQHVSRIIYDGMSEKQKRLSREMNAILGRRKYEDAKAMVAKERAAKRRKLRV